MLMRLLIVFTFRPFEICNYVGCAFSNILFKLNLYESRDVGFTCILQRFRVRYGATVLNESMINS